MEKKPGRLYVVSTPIGNLEDITLRALRILKEVGLIAAEDTRHTQILLNRYNIETPQTSYHDYNKEIKACVLIEKLKDGMDIALVSDAGTPGISDPGYYLIRRAIEEGISIIPIPGITAAIASLSISGLPTDSFVFEGFLPHRATERIKRLKELVGEKRTLILYEAPHRLMKCLANIAFVLGDRRLVITRELTKIHEEVIRGKTEEVIKALSGKRIRGEITIIIEGKGRGERPFSSTEVKDEDIRKRVNNIVAEKGISKKEAISAVAKELEIPKKLVYKAMIKK